MRFSIIFFLAIFLSALFSGCIEDGYATSPDQQPLFSTDTLRLGSVWAGEASPTVRMTVRNTASANLRISSIELTGEAASCFRINVDGMSGDRFSDVEIRPNDSIFIFAQAVCPHNPDTPIETVLAEVSFTTNGVISTLPIKATAVSPVTVTQLEITEEEIWNDVRPYRVMNTLRIAPGGSLTLAPGTEVRLHDGARIDVEGAFITEGSVEKPVIITGDRLGNVVGDIPFTLMSKQWDGLYLHPASSAVMSHTIVSNALNGFLATESDITLINCVIRNSGGDAFAATGSRVEAIGCEFSDAAGAAVGIDGGVWLMSHCTIANFYLFAAQTEAAVRIENVATAEARIENSIIYSRGADLNLSDLTATSITLHRCLLRSVGSDDANFISCIWDSDPKFLTDRSRYIFDYRLQADSPAIGAAETTDAPDPRAAIDRYGLPRTIPADLGAYVFSPPSESAL